MAAQSDHGLPGDVWAHIVQYCSTSTLKALALVCHPSSEEARRCLVRDISYGEGHRHRYKVLDRGTNVRDLTLLRQSLESWTGWRSSVHHVRMELSHKGPEYNYVRCNWEERFWSEDDDRLTNDLIRDNANLLSKSIALESFHLEIPHLGSSLPFAVPRITSLRVPVVEGFHEDIPTDFGPLFKLFQITSLVEIELHNMRRLDTRVPEEYRQPGFSNVTHLGITHCGPIQAPISDLLSWPKNLRTLRLAMGFPEKSVHFSPYAGYLTPEGILNPILPLRKSLVDLQIAILDEPPEPIEGTAFETFEALRRLNIPLDLLMEYSVDPGAPPPDHIALPIHLRLPPRLERLSFNLRDDFPWCDTKDGFWTDTPGPLSKQLFVWLSGLAEHKAEMFPNLHLLTLCDAGPPLDCEHTRKFTLLMQRNGISVSFD